MELINIISDYILYGSGLLVLVIVINTVFPKYFRKSNKRNEQKGIDLVEYKKLLKDRNLKLQNQLAMDRIASERASGSTISQNDLNITNIYFTRRSMVQQPARFKIINEGHEIKTTITR
ncbi:MAG: hypothetical protein KKA84_04625 [Bacteroidetes bacterium]|nr:hypothetical protein [Bacteroidota bacterium]